MKNVPSLNILILDGSGYIGSAIMREALKFPGIKLTSVQRSIPSQPLDPRINYVQGSALNPETFRDELRHSDVVIHSIGVLIDPTITKLKPKGCDGSYEQIQFETAKRIGDLLQTMSEKKRKVFYLSAKYGIPFIPRYLYTKRQAEQYLAKLNGIQFKAFYPGLVVDAHERILTVPVGLVMNGVHAIQNCWPIRNLSALKYIGPVFDYLRVDHAIQRADLAKAIVYCALNNEFDEKQVMEYNDMIAASRKMQVN